MRNLRHSEMRRSSAAGLSGTTTSQRPPLPPKIETRCHSYDGLLGDDAKKRRTPEGRDGVDGAAKEPTTVQHDDESAVKPAPPEESMKAKNRRSRSMDDLFDDDHTAVSDFLENTQSMENLSEPATVPSSPPPPPTPETPVPTGGGNICLNRRFVEPPAAVESRSSATASPDSCYEEPCENEVITVDSTVPRREEDAISTTSSLTSGTGTGSAGKKTTNNSPFINKYVKKVKSLMKK